MKRLNIALLAFMALLLSSCLKDKLYNSRQSQAVRPDNNPGVIEIGLTATTPASVSSNFLLASFNASNNDTIVNAVPINLASPNPAPEDIHVTVERVDALVSSYNTAHGTSYQVPLATKYTIVNPVVTIPKGSRTGFLQIKFKPSDFIGADYAFGFRITNVDKAGYQISTTYSTGVFAFGIKNKYDGNYSMTIRTTGWAAYGIADGPTATWPSNIGLITAGANSVSILDYLRGDNLQPAFAAGASSTTVGSPTAFGATTPFITFDPVTNKVSSVVNSTPDDGRGRFLLLNTSAINTNTYDPATRKISLAYIMKQNGRPDQFIYITLTYVGPR